MRSKVFRLFALLVILTMVVSPVAAKDTDGRAPADNTGSVSTTTGAASEEAVPAAADLPESPTGLYVVRLKDPSLSGYSGGIAGLAPTSPEATGTRKLDVTTAASQAYLSYLETQQQEAIRSVEATLGRSVEVKFQYMNVLNAFAVALDHAEALKVAALPGVTVYPDAIRELDTDVGPLLIGAPAIWEGETASGVATQGEGVIIGVIDSGINSQHPSFAATDESGYTHTNPYGPGNYKGWCAANPSFCNAKLVGAYNYNPVGQTPEDLDGHGSHTASTAGGNRHTANFTVGNDPYEILIQGVAPRANIIAFKVCNPSCPSSASVAAVNQGIADGVDVFNYSISGSDNPWGDLVDLAFLDAFNAGAYVSASAGNAGPGPSTVAKTGPWNAAVAASTHNRAIVQTLDVTAPAMPPALQDIAVVPGEGTNILSDLNAPLRYVAANNDGCVAFPPGSFTGAFALIQRGGCTFAVKVNNAVAAGATGVVVFNSVGGPPITMGGLTGTPPAVMMDLNSGIALRDYVVANPTTTTVRINAATSLVYINEWEDIVAGFSSRGPSQFEILKPDYIAPGVNILAAVAQEPGAPIQYGFLQGTSMSSPHSAGAAALMVALNPTWGPAEIKSAMAATTEGGLFKEDGLTAADPFDVGSGRLALELAAHAGLVFNETYANYVAANPAIGGDPKTLNQPSVVSKECAGSCSWTRTVKSVASTPLAYTASIQAPAGVVVTVTPSTFTLAPGATQVLNISADASGAAPDVWAFGSITLTPTPGSMVNEVLLSEAFTDATFPPAGWSVHKLAGAGTSTWIRDTAQSLSPPASARRIYGGSADGDQDDWLVTPPLALNSAVLSYFDRGQWMGDYGYSGVWISTGSCDPADDDFVELLETADIPSNAWRATPVVVDLGAYSGEIACLAFRYGGVFAHTWWIDDVVVDSLVASTYSAIHVPVVVRPTLSVPVITLNPPSITSSQGPDTIVPKTLTIGNAGGASLIWNVFTDAPLLRPFGQATVVESSPAGRVTIGDLSLAGSGLTGSATPAFTPTPDSTTITHSASQTIQAGNSVACAASGLTVQNQYLRTFTLSNFGIVGEFDVTSVSFGIESATIAHNATVNLYTLNGALNYANMTLIGTATANITAQNLTILTVPVTANVPAGGTLVVEVVSPNLQPVGGAFFVGSNNLGQTAPSYLASSACGIAQPTDTAAIGVPGMHIVMNVTGTADAPTCDVPNSWASIAPTGGTVAPGASTNATVTFDSTGVPVGTYTANLCLESNDPALGLALVPLTMNVEDAAHISVSPEFFDFAIPVGGSDTGTLTISNLGVGDLVWNIAEEPGPESLLTWSDNFDSYAAGSQLHGQGGWKGWQNDPTAGALVSTAQASSAPNSAAILGASDLVHEYSGYTSGGWTYKTMMYFPSDFTGESYFILLNTYNDAAVGLNWSTQINFQAATNLVVNTGASGGNLPLIRGQWVELRIEIDLTANTQSAFYNNQLLYSGSWSNEVSGGGALNIAAVDLFANGASVVYYDDISLEPSVYVPEVCEMPANVPWLSVSPTSGTTPGGESDDVAVTASAAGLAAGAYSANLCVTSNDPANPLVVVPVDLEVLGEVPAIEVAPEMLDFTVMQGVSDSEALVISNVGMADLVWEVGEEAPATRTLTEQLYDNGPLVTHPGGGAGGADVSALQTALGLNTFGFGVQLSAGNRIADEFTITDPEGWAVETITFFAYQTGSPTTSTFTAVNLRIWDGPPNLPTSNVTFGDTTTNRLVSTVWTNIYRTIDTNLLDSARPIMTVVAEVGTVLPPGTYWVDWQAAGTLASGPWAPPISILGQAVTGNGMQFTPTGGWANLIDTGTAAASQGVPFQVHGTLAAAPVCSTLGDVEWLSAAPSSGTTPAGESDDVTVTADATGLELGSYSANLCVASNDPMKPLVVVPVSLEVIEYVGWAPEAGFTFDYPVYEGVPVHFTNTTTGEGPITYAWDFGDGGTSTAVNPTYTFAAAGAYTVTLTATNMWGDGIYEELVVVAPPLPGHADLSVAITVSPTPVQVGVETTFTAVVTNHGPDPVSGVYVSGDLPENVEFISGVNCSLDEGVLSCDLGTIGVDESKTAVVVLKFTAAGSFEISLDVIGDLDDPVPGNNGGTVTIEVTQPAVQEYWIYAPIIRRGQ
jgi:uncharacterized repeat protein (TIGR01451 family)